MVNRACAQTQRKQTINRVNGLPQLVTREYTCITLSDRLLPQLTEHDFPELGRGHLQGTLLQVIAESEVCPHLHQ